MDRLMLSYLAGYVDGDGAVMLRPVSKKPGSYMVTLMVGSCCEAQCRLFESLFGGTVHRKKHQHVAVDGSTRPYFDWRVTHAAAEAALRQITPFLRVRREQAEVALAYRARVGKRGLHVTADEAAARVSFHDRMTTLNARGISAPLRQLGQGEAAATDAEELAYLAGLFDAEGTIAWINDRERTVPLLHVGVMNTVDLACWRFALRFGGSVHLSYAGSNVRGIFKWYRRQAKAVRVLQALLPYLREKRHAAEVALTTGIQPATRVRPLRAVRGGQ